MIPFTKNGSINMKLDKFQFYYWKPTIVRLDYPFFVERFGKLPFKSINLEFHNIREPLLSIYSGIYENVNTLTCS